MEIVGLISGGKDSCYNLMCAVEKGHKIVALANLHPETPKEIDSFMYQTVASEGVEKIAAAMGLPLYRKVISGASLNQNAAYEKTDGDEVEDLYELLKEVKKNHPGLRGVSAGAILSSYQKQRVEEVCKRLDLEPVCFLWERDQKLQSFQWYSTYCRCYELASTMSAAHEELLREMISAGVEAILVKVAAIGLNEQHLGKSLSEMEPTLLKLEQRFGVHPCGEGGEYETFVTNCPLFRKRISIKDARVVHHERNNVSPVCFLLLNHLELVDKS